MDNVDNPGAYLKLKLIGKAYKARVSASHKTLQRLGNLVAFMRLTLVDDQAGPYEVQIQTIEDYINWREGEKAILRTLAASPKYGFVLEP